jgi:hypothetical protein
MFSTRYFDPDESIEFYGVFFMDIACIDAVYSTIYRQEVRRPNWREPKISKIICL